MAERPDENSTDEIDITPAMVAAGFRVLANSGLVDECLEADTLFLEKIYREMYAASRRGNCGHSLNGEALLP
jgi:hypothetical protein